MAYPLPDKPSIAVLPFANLNNDPKDDYICDGLTEQVITSLSTFHTLFVIARNSSFAYKGKAVKVQQVAEDLGVQYIMEGSVLKSGEKLRITVQLIDALTGHHVWSERYDRELKDFFALQDEITIHILNAMKVEVTIGPLERHYAKIKTNNLKAYEKNYQGVGFFLRMNKQDNETARRLFQEALALDPKYYWPLVLLGYTYVFDAQSGWSENPAQSIQLGSQCAQKALSMDDTLDPAHSLLATVYLAMRQHDKAVAEAKRAVDLNPNGALPLRTFASILGSSGQWEQSILYEKQSMRLNPIPDPFDYVTLGRAQFMTEKYEDSITTLKKAIKINPDYLSAHIILAADYSSLNRNSEAAAAAKEILRLNPHFTLEAHAKILPYKNKADIERMVAALRRAGLK
jgi:adenylate cyclase